MRSDKNSKIFKRVNRLRLSVVWGNLYNKFDLASPFGDYKQSGWQRLAAYCRLIRLMIYAHLHCHAPRY